MSKPFPDTSFGVGLVVVVTLPAPVTEKIKEAAKKRGKTVAGWCRAELIPAVEMPGSDDRIRAVLDAATAAERRAAAVRLTGADWERIADGVRISPAELEAAAEVEMERGETTASWSPAEFIAVFERVGPGGSPRFRARSWSSTCSRRSTPSRAGVFPRAPAETR